MKILRSEWFQLSSVLEKHGNTIGFSSFIFSFFPLPFVNSVQSLAMINFLIYLLIFVFIIRYKLSNNRVDYFYLLFPSLLLYSSLALRDNLILLFMFISLYLIIIKERSWLGILLALPLLIFKFQNYLILIAGLIVFRCLRGGNTYRYLFFIAVVVLASFIPEKIPFVGSMHEKVNYWRYWLFVDNFEYNWDIIKQVEHTYVPLNTGFYLIYQVTSSFFYMLLKPLIWEVENPFQLIQSLENTVIFAMIILINRKKVVNEKIMQKILFLNCLLFVSMTINGLVVFNFGTAVRYKFPFIVIYFVYFLYLLKSDELFLKQAQAAWNGGSRIGSAVSPS